MLEAYQAGLAAAGLLLLCGVWSWIVESFHAVNRRFYLARVRWIWRQNIGDHDIIAQTGERCWMTAYDDGISPWDAIFNGTARAGND